MSGKTEVLLRAANAAAWRAICARTFGAVEEAREFDVSTSILLWGLRIGSPRDDR